MVELYGRVRYAVQIERLSRREAARQLGIDRNSAGRPRPPESMGMNSDAARASSRGSDGERAACNAVSFHSLLDLQAAISH